MYQGENRKGGALISYYIDKPEVDEKNKKGDTKEDDNNDDENELRDKKKDDSKNVVKYDSIQLEIFDNIFTVILFLVS